jgi:hypothetical protein
VGAAAPTSAPGAPAPEVVLAEFKDLLNGYVRQVAALVATAPPGRLTLSGADCNRLEETLPLGCTQSPSSLVAAVERLASLRFGDIRIPFTPGQLQEIQHRAAKRGRTVEAEMQAVVDRIRDELFYRGG